MITTICYVAAHSGGHIIPCIRLAEHPSSLVRASQLGKLRRDAERANNSVVRTILITSNNTLDTTIAQNAAINTHYELALPAHVSALSVKTIWWGMKLLWSTIKCIYIFLSEKPARVISTGGIIAMPATIAAYICRIPVELVELNAIPGKATLFLAPWAKNIFICFEEARKYFAQELGNKKCPTISVIEYPLTQKERVKKVHPKWTLTILGGSQGSLGINTMIEQLVLQKLLPATIHIIHQIGAQDMRDWQHFYAENNMSAEVITFTNTIDEIYAQSDLIICRAGAGSLWEIIAWNIPCITIPLVTAYTDHQVDNAHACARRYPELVNVLQQKNIESDIKILARLIDQNRHTILRESSSHRINRHHF